MLDWLKKALGAGGVSGPAAEAYAAHDAGDFARALPLLEAHLAQQPQDAEALYRLGDTLYQLERLPEALPPLERAAALDGKRAAIQYKLGNVLKDLERPDDALACYQRALAIEPAHAQALNNAGTVLEGQGRTEEALRHYREAVAADRALTPAHGNLATLLLRLGRTAEAAKAYEALVALNPRSAGDWCNLGNAYQASERYEDALPCYEKALAIDPALAGAHYQRSTALLSLGRYADAEAAARRSADLAPSTECWSLLGEILQMQYRFDEALGAYQHGLRIDPDAPALLNNVGAAYRHKGDPDSACRFFERAIAASPQFIAPRLNWVTTRFGLGLVEGAAERYREILDIEPTHAHASRQLLTALLYLPGGPDELFEAHRDFSRRLASSIRKLPVPRRSGTARRKLRIGYLSSDLRKHPVGHNMTPVFRHHDREAFEIYVYSAARQPDDMTRWFRSQALAWRQVAYLSDEAVANQVRQDEIDILVLLAGRFDDNRPLVAAYRPAPVQVSLHDPATSGLEEMDYLIADRTLVPRDTTERFTERVICLPTFYLHAPLDDAPPPSPAPAARQGQVTFGSFNNPSKVNDRVIALWARVLHAVPESRLLLKFLHVFGIPSVRERILERFREHGVPPERIVIPADPGETRDQHLARYAQIDIALDPFPFTGSTTTFESLWMGVPVVTLAGDRMVSRWSAAMLRKVGLAHLVARSEADYVEIAKTLAAEPGGLGELRQGLRERVARSPLCDGPARVRQLERLYRRLWARWLARQAADGNR